MLGKETVRIGLQEDIPVRTSNLELVVSPLGHTRHKDLPNTRSPEGAHHVTPAIPPIEITHDADPLRIRSPDSKGCSGNTGYRPEMSAKNAVGLEMLTLTQEIEIHVSQRRGKGMGIRIGNHPPVGMRRLNRVALGGVRKS